MDFGDFVVLFAGLGVFGKCFHHSDLHANVVQGHYSVGPDTVSVAKKNGSATKMQKRFRFRSQFRFRLAPPTGKEIN